MHTRPSLIYIIILYVHAGYSYTQPHPELDMISHVVEASQEHISATSLRIEDLILQPAVQLLRVGF